MPYPAELKSFANKTLNGNWYEDRFQQDLANKNQNPNKTAALPSTKFDLNETSRVMAVDIQGVSESVH